MPKSDANHTGEKQVPFWLDADTLQKWDEAINILNYKSRAERFREMVRDDIKTSRK